jgi:hypothetical protein
MRNNPLFQSSKVSICAGLFASVVAGCAIVDDVGLRSETMNDSMARYNNHSILLNIVRASEYEPLNFVAVTQGSPNTSFGGNAAAPTFAFNPYHLASTTINGNSVTSTASNQLVIQPIDDPASWQAMLTPVDVGTIGFFTKQSYPTEILFWLFTDRLRITTGSNEYEELINDPNDPSFRRFAVMMINLIGDGLTVEVETGAPKSGQTPASEICFKRSAARAAWEMAKRIPRAPDIPEPIAPPLPKGDSCGPWTPGQAADSQSTSSSAKATAPIYVVLDPKILPKKEAPPPPPSHSAWYDLPPPEKIPPSSRAFAWRHRPDFLPPKGSKIQFSTRSPYAVYLYLGRWLKGDFKSVELLTIPYDDNLVTIDRNSSLDCFTEVSYKLQQYCVPNSAYNTKRTFSVLHQIVGLNIAHVSTSPPLSVRAVP